MGNLEVNVKQLIEVKDPRLSLTQFSRYADSTVNGRRRILLGCKYPDYIPKYYDLARTILCATFSSNFNDFDLYFEEFKRYSAKWKNEAVGFSPKTDDHKNRFYSAKALDGIVRMKTSLYPVLSKYVLRDNRKRASILINEVKITAKADLLLFDELDNQLGLLRFNFPQAKLKAMEAELALTVMRQNFRINDGLEFMAKDCVLVDVYSGMVIRANDKTDAILVIDDTTKEIRNLWAATKKQVI